MPEIIGIGNGNYSTKTLNTTIASGVVEYETDPFIPNGKIKYKGKYYVCGGETGNLMKDKTKSNAHYILTLAAIAKEIEVRRLNRTLEVVLAVGLPLTLIGPQKKSFKEYLMQNKRVEYEMEGKQYNITIKDVILSPQGYSAIICQQRLRASGGDAKSVQGDIGHAKADTLLNTYSYIEDARRANLTMTIAKNFYGEDVIDEVMSNDKEIDDDIIKRITSDPELQKRTLAALLSNLG